MKQRNRKLACLCIAGALLATAGVYQSSQDTENTTTAVAREYAVENDVTKAQPGQHETKEKKMEQPEGDTYGVRAGAVNTAKVEMSEIENTLMETALNEENIDQETAVVDSLIENNNEDTVLNTENDEETIVQTEETAALEDTATASAGPAELTGTESAAEEITARENTVQASFQSVDHVSAAAQSIEEQNTAEAVLGTETIEEPLLEAQTTEEQTAEELNPEDETAEAPAEEPEAPQPETIVAQVTNYVNVRSMPSEEGEILGKLYNDSIGTVIAEEGEWLKINSGNVEGFVKAEFVLRGEEGRAKAEEVGTRLAKVTATTLRVRQEATTESDTLGLVPVEKILPVTEEVEGWAKVSDEGVEGYVSTEFTELYTENSYAESREEEEARLRLEEEQRQAEEAARLAAEAAERASRESSQAASNKQSSQASSGTAPAPSVSSNSSMGQNIANYALQFVGNPYVYGGTSLTNGADCSGFIMSVYKNFGISLPRTSGEQGQSGTNVGGLGNAQPGDLVSYSGHIGIYIGGGQIVHASTAKTGIKVSNASYRPILSVRRIV